MKQKRGLARLSRHLPKYPRKRLLVTSLTLGMMVALSGINPAFAADSASAKAPTSTTNAKAVPILLVAAGQDAEISPINGTDSYRLRMLGTQDLITWFTDRPARETGLMLAHDLAQQWNRIGFKAVPPNSALVLRDAGFVHTFTVETTNPKYANGVLAFTIRPLSKKPMPLPAKAATASLFIDDVAVPVNATNWQFHSIIPATAQNQYVAKFKLQNGAVNSATSSYIYSIPASALIADYSIPHLNIANNGINLRGYVTPTPSS